ncbi:MAG: ATB BETA protein [Circoviridae sp.]|nr:MAG: ATB BETA protein [Circoviridae sp.]
MHPVSLLFCHVWAEEPLPVKASDRSQAKLGFSIAFVNGLRAGVIMNPAQQLRKDGGGYPLTASLASLILAPMTGADIRVRR